MGDAAVFKSSEALNYDEEEEANVPDDDDLDEPTHKFDKVNVQPTNTHPSSRAVRKVHQ